jgi:Resolvase, N terminal domain
MRLIGALYVRKSNEQRDRIDEEKSVARQISRGRDFVNQKLHGDVPEEFVFMDDAISGAEFDKRSDLARLLRCVEQKPRPPFAFLVVMEEARLGRETIEIPHIVKQIVQAGVRMFSYQTGREWTLIHELVFWRGRSRISAAPLAWVVNWNRW